MPVDKTLIKISDAKMSTFYLKFCQKNRDLKCLCKNPKARESINTYIYIYERQ